MLVQLRRFGAAFVPGWIAKPRRLTRGLIPGPGRARIGHQSLFMKRLGGKVKEIASRLHCGISEINTKSRWPCKKYLDLGILLGTEDAVGYIKNA